MWPYWLIWGLPALMTFQESVRVRGRLARRLALGRITANWWLAILTLTLVVGWRHEVGGDWFNYLRNFEGVIQRSQDWEWWGKAPGYRLLEWIAAQAEWGIDGVNLMAAALFAFGLVRFCRHLPLTW